MTGREAKIRPSDPLLQILIYYDGQREGSVTCEVGTICVDESAPVGKGQHSVGSWGLSLVEVDPRGAFPGSDRQRAVGPWHIPRAPLATGLPRESSSFAQTGSPEWSVAKGL